MGPRHSGQGARPMIRAARGLHHSRRMMVAAREREDKALAALQVYLAQTGEARLSLGAFEVWVEGEGLQVRRLASAPGTQLPLEHLEVIP